MAGDFRGPGAVVGVVRGRGLSNSGRVLEGIILRATIPRGSVCFRGNHKLGDHLWLEVTEKSISSRVKGGPVF